MPEILTKHPEIVLKILKDAGIQCGTGQKQQILTTCPKDSFCSLPTGELCIYGLHNMASMTQLKQSEHQLHYLPFSIFSVSGLSLIILVFALGTLLGMYLKK